ncbi:UvrD-helicase domain-containing protein [Telmatospirillum siberiense]|uniref:DNA helicase UvrD n=1 Tax=Telmatospirillum siberiense TaxID=382514 RepID=A0A2N3PQP8_9PROT|nr:UvrD-helicase domain-containing protein [Telmatospirillum siberiense]PKU22729.1 DNA helicase UvrD [Telmatospirillum siberiense]
MTFHADLHVHSKYSRATSRDLDLERLAWWAAVKGIEVVGTGDCVHPGWVAEIKEKLEPAGGGLYRLRQEIRDEIGKTLPAACRNDVRFLLTTEISTIYKKGDKTRKVHHLVCLPDLDAVDRLAGKLARIGNIASDGRPILGLDSRNLLEVVLESGSTACLIPAHIWTPWFAALGSQSGFDSIADCYGDLAGHIFAVETGLSSDPEMNWRVSSLDRYRLVSNSDAHSPAKLGREATRFACAPDYFQMMHALKTGDGYVGTVEFFPEEGKYHLDGHRACDVRLDPKETLALGGRCPVCGHPVTVGVAHRVEMLADRDSGTAPPPSAGTVASLVPLPEILSELLGSGVASQTVGQAFDRIVGILGPELSILGAVPIEDIAGTTPLLGEAVARLRAGSVIRQAGYDGEYGVIRLFAEGELDRRSKGDMLFEAPVIRRRAAGATAKAPAVPSVPTGAAERAPPPSGRTGVLAALDADQARAAEVVDGPVAVIAGPGSGKTRMLTHRIAHLIRDCGVPAGNCLAITFTRRATEELRSRLAVLLPGRTRKCAVESFHSLGLGILKAHGALLGLPADFRVADEAERRSALAAALSIGEKAAGRLIKKVSALKRSAAPAEGEDGEALETLARLGREAGWVDFDDLVGLSVELLERNPEIARRWRGRFTHILADEFQDIDAWQYRILKVLAGENGNLCVIGDPDQAIYGFRGADATCFERFAQDFPSAKTIRLGRNYRSSGAIVAAASAIVGRAAEETAVRPTGDSIVLHTASSEGAEAVFVGGTIETLMGGHDMLAANRKTGGKKASGPLGFADVAVLYRTDAQAAALRAVFDRAGIPFRKSTPAPIAGHEGVVAILDALAGQSGQDRAPDLQARLEAAADAAARREETGAATLAEAKGWLKTLAAAYGDEKALREQVALSTEADFHDARADRVSLLTMHAAKGLEFPVVFVVGLEDGLVPFSFPGSPEDAGSLAEERRLFYVAVTRARDRLFLTRATERFWYGKTCALPPSPFLQDIPPHLTRHETAAAPAPRAKQYNLF